MKRTSDGFWLFRRISALMYKIQNTYVNIVMEFRANMRNYTELRSLPQNIPSSGKLAKVTPVNTPNVRWHKNDVGDGPSMNVAQETKWKIWNRLTKIFIVSWLALREHGAEKHVFRKFGGQHRGRWSRILSSSKKPIFSERGLSHETV